MSSRCWIGVRQAGHFHGIRLFEVHPFPRSLHLVQLRLELGNPLELHVPVVLKLLLPFSQCVQNEVPLVQDIDDPIVFCASHVNTAQRRARDSLRLRDFAPR